MPDEKPIDVMAGDVACIRVGAFTDDDGDHVVLVSIGGMVFGTCSETLEEGKAMARRVLDHLVKFQSSPTITVLDHTKSKGLGGN
jgi:hypothetical protein